MSSQTKHTIGTVIKGTSDSKVIINAFLQEVRKHDPELFFDLIVQSKTIEDFESTEAHMLLAELMEILCSYASSEYIFTSHPYEPLNYGFWSTTLFNS